ncbi:MAG: substrate-binding domain-containing protein [Pseudonocardiales bacterium]|nr:substrate-binding domain-containing protein [Pseudonocardiales bacterium]
MRSWTTAAVAALMAIAAACGSPGSARDGVASVEQGFPIGILLPDWNTSRYETFDRPLLTQRLKELCPHCEVLYQNASQNSAAQQSQAEALLTSGVRVLILDAVDSIAASAIVTNAKSQGVAVVAYDRLASGPVDYYVSYDSERIGQVQATALLTALQAGGDPKRGKIVMINGSPTDPNVAAFKRGAHSVLDGQVVIGQEYDTPDWSPDRAQQEMEQAITALGREAIIGVYAANDGTAAGVIAALKGVGFAPLPPVTGQDAELAGVQRILAGEQYMTVYKDIKREARIAAEMAIAAATRVEYRGRPTQTVSGSSVGVPGVFLEPIAVTRENVASVIIGDGIYPAQEVCSTEYRQACRRAGIS